MCVIRPVNSKWTTIQRKSIVCQFNKLINISTIVLMLLFALCFAFYVHIIWIELVLNFTTVYIAPTKIRRQKQSKQKR